MIVYFVVRLMRNTYRTYKQMEIITTDAGEAADVFDQVQEEGDMAILGNRRI